MAGRYTTRNGETAKDVAHKFTGDEDRYLDLMPVNPHLGTVTGHMGRPEFDPRDWHDGLGLKLPQRWVDAGQIHGPRPVYRSMAKVRAERPGVRRKKWRKYTPNPFEKKWRRLGYLGQGNDYGEADYGKKEEMEESDGGASGSGCNFLPKGSGKVKPYLFAVPAGEGLVGITQTWLDTSNVYGRGLYTWSELAAVNRDKTKSMPDGDCRLKNNVSLIRIPEDWPACPTIWADRRRNADGTPYTGGEPPAPKPPGGNEGFDRVDVTEGEGGGLVLFVLAAAAAVGGGILLYNAGKKKR